MCESLSREKMDVPSSRNNNSMAEVYYGNYHRYRLPTCGHSVAEECEEGHSIVLPTLYEDLLIHTIGHHIVLRVATVGGASTRNLHLKPLRVFASMPPLVGQ